MTVNFSVVGIFYRYAVDFTQVPGRTVLDVMNYITKVDKNFTLTELTFQGNRIVNSLGYVHPADFTGRTGITYPQGMYQLAQSFTDPTPNPYSVWQYYLFDQNGIRQPAQADFSYTQAKVADGWSIVWRLVTICNAPTAVAKRLRSLVPPEQQDALRIS
ncbi:hypothetical protein [Methylobacterium sp. V23]|uniref:hypothetical protein n=1 Tax=Methylobacterium sp. V23 TaxID=2044878 RepID=UPI000CDB6F00|nr:hypothetical protein [Methylobacterium sp. V23]POR43048.1 hypothetical protein CRT23_09635 [Methylobacterium sp. V23]